MKTQIIQRLKEECNFPIIDTETEECLSPLVFSSVWEFTEKQTDLLAELDVFDFDSESNDFIVYTILNAAFYFHSLPAFCDNKYEYETSSGSYRSAIDIWRHVYYYKKMSIFEVMKSLHNLAEKKMIGGHFCPDVERAVFYTLKRPATVHAVYFSGFNENHLPEYDITEFGIKFNDWRHL